MNLPLDPCGLAVDLARYAGRANLKPWRDANTRQSVHWYFVPRDRPCLPIPHTFLNGGFNDRFVLQDAPDGRAGEDGTSFKAGFTLVFPWAKDGLHFCGSEDAWLNGATAADPALVWTEFGYSTCCEGIKAVGTLNTVAKFGNDGLSLKDSRIKDTGTGPVEVEAPLCMHYACLQETAAPAAPPAGEAYFYVDPAGAIFLRRSSGSPIEVPTGPVYEPGGTDVAIGDGGTGASNAAEARTNLGLGTMAVQAANAVAITGGTITGVTGVAPATPPSPGTLTAASQWYLLGTKTHADLTDNDTEQTLTVYTLPAKAALLRGFIRTKTAGSGGGVTQLLMRWAINGAGEGTFIGDGMLLNDVHGTYHPTDTTTGLLVQNWAGTTTVGVIFSSVGGNVADLTAGEWEVCAELAIMG